LAKLLSGCEVREFAVGSVDIANDGFGRVRCGMKDFKEDRFI
jgi:hypothetical protein